MGLGCVHLEDWAWGVYTLRTGLRTGLGCVHLGLGGIGVCTVSNLNVIVVWSWPVHGLASSAQEWTLPHHYIQSIHNHPYLLTHPT